MLLVDRDIENLIEQNILKNASTANIGTISYDLTIEKIISSTKEKDAHTRYDLKPNGVAFIASKENIFLTNTLVAHVEQRNSRIRQGLVVDAPTYQPGHKTKVFFRVHNISSEIITLKAGDSIASLSFEQLDHAPNQSYNGNFVDEFEYSGLGNYSDSFAAETQSIRKEIRSIEHIERSIYATVMTLMTIFVGMFSLLNINIDFFNTKAFDFLHLLAYNLVIIGSLGIFAALISLLIPRQNVGKKQFVIPSLFIVASLIISIIPS